MDGSTAGKTRLRGVQFMSSTWSDIGQQAIWVKKATDSAIDGSGCRNRRDTVGGKNPSQQKWLRLLRRKSTLLLQRQGWNRLSCRTKPLWLGTKGSAQATPTNRNSSRQGRHMGPSNRRRSDTDHSRSRFDLLTTASPLTPISIGDTLPINLLGMT